jgi:hypothetical protein
MITLRGLPITLKELQVVAHVVDFRRIVAKRAGNVLAGVARVSVYMSKDLLVDFVWEYTMSRDG